MEKKFIAGQRVTLKRETEDFRQGHVVSVDDEYTVVQFDDLEGPSVFDKAELMHVELCEENDVEKD